ncbi:MAG: hypothetical protein U1E05_22490 [Patescibacteria group bacterium]|nr:hypothetical protein [Patescibacteria group bacterium]
MRGDDHRIRLLLAGAGVLLLAVTGCQGWGARFRDPAPAPLGALSDPIWRTQEANAARSDFVVHQHEFEGDTEWLNTGGEDHVKQIAFRLLNGQDAHVLVERSMTSVRADSEFKYPVHPNPELDMRRRDIVVRSLAAMGVADAHDRVVVSPALTPGYTADEAESAYRTGIDSSSTGVPQGGFGGFMNGSGRF